jgi:hypothetical protein
MQKKETKKEGNDVPFINDLNYQYHRKDAVVLIVQIINKWYIIPFLLNYQYHRKDADNHEPKLGVVNVVDS